MIDDMGAHHVLQTTRNPPVNAPRIRRSKNGFRASMALCPRVPGLHIAKSCSDSPHPARPTTKIRAHRKRLQRLSRHSDTSDCSERLAKKERSDQEQCSNFIEPRILRASGRGRVYKTPTNPPSGALRVLAGKYCLPDARNETLRPCRVRRVFVAKLLNHHPLLRADAKRAEDRERDQVRRTCHPIRDDERLADGIQR